MAKKQWPDVHAGTVWRDRDKRMLSGNRRVRVVKVSRAGETVTVFYKSVAGPNDAVIWDTIFKSRYERFQRVFEPLDQPEAVNAVAKGVEVL